VDILQKTTVHFSGFFARFTDFLMRGGGKRYRAGRQNLFTFEIPYQEDEKNRLVYCAVSVYGAGPIRL
jgi:hypothetical protein